MPILPHDPDQRWNRILVIGIVAFSVWVILVVTGQIFGDNRDVRDDAALIIAVGGFLALLLGQYRHGQRIDTTDAKIEQASATVADTAAMVSATEARVETTHAEVTRATAIAEQVYEHINNVEEQERVPDDGEPERPTLGSLLRRIDSKVDAGFAQSREADELLQAQLEELREATAVEAPPPPPPAPAPAAQKQPPAQQQPQKKPPPPPAKGRR